MLFKKRSNEEQTSAANTAPPSSNPITQQGFADVPWGSNPNAVQQLLMAKGYTFNQMDDQGDLEFEGNLIGYPATILMMMSGGQLVKAFVTLITPDHKARSVYTDLKTTLRRKYGQPSNEFQFFQDPYADGDGFEDLAISVGMATYATYWTHGDASVSIQISEGLNVDIVYESPAWLSESNRRIAQSHEDF
jgi:hypothetical protein